MSQRPTRWPFAALLVATIIPGLPSLPGTAPVARNDPNAPNLAQIAVRGRETLSRFERDTAAWTTIFQMPAPGNAIVITTTRSPQMRKLAVSLNQNGRTHDLLRIIERDQAWYVVSNDTVFKCRPYEVVLPLPALYVFMARTELLAVIDDKPFGNFVALNGNISTYRTELPAEMKRQLQASIDALEKIRPKATKQQLAEIEARVSAMREAMEHGLKTDVDTETGVVIASGGIGQRFAVKNFRWLVGDSEAEFTVDKKSVRDLSSGVLQSTKSPDDLLMMGHLASWKPGAPLQDTDAVLVNMATGEQRRVPYPFGLSAPGCFAKDRKSLFVGGQIPNQPAMGLYQIDLASGDVRRLGENVLTGIVQFPVLSPDGKTLAVVHKSGSEPDVLKFQICLVDVASGEGKLLGEPLDTAIPSWLPDGSGLVLVTREYESPNKPSIDTIALMDLNGQVTSIRKGSRPLVLNPFGRILYSDQADDRWKICDLDGKEIAVVGDGLKDFGFPTASPDGKRLVMLRFGGPDGPRPHLVDLETGQSTPLNIEKGFWSLPSWR